MTPYDVRSAGDYSRDELNALLVKGGKIDGWLPTQAAVHLLTYTHLPASVIRQYIYVDTRWSMADQETRVGAWVRDWNALARDKKVDGTDWRMVQLAAAFAVGRKVNLPDVLSMQLGWAHVRRVIEATVIQTNMSGYLTIAGTPRLGDYIAEYRRLGATVPDAPAIVGEHEASRVAAALDVIRVNHLGGDPAYIIDMITRALTGSGPEGDENDEYREFISSMHPASEVREETP